MNVDQGSSGAPILIVNPDYNGKNAFALVIGMLAWLRITNGGNFIGGPAQKQLELSYNKILKLNCLEKPIIKPRNFNGKHGKGFLGLASYIPLDQDGAFYLCSKYPAYLNSQFANKIGGFIVYSITDPTNPQIKVPNSRVNNAKNLATGQRTGIQIDDIIIEVNGVMVDLNNNPEYVTFDSYNNRFKPIFMKIIRPSIGKIMEFEVISDKYPKKYEIVSEIPGTIELIASVIYNNCSTSNLTQVGNTLQVTITINPNNISRLLVLNYLNEFVPSPCNVTFNLNGNIAPISSSVTFQGILVTTIFTLAQAFTIN
jgi:hypothetical protein